MRLNSSVHGVLVAGLILTSRAMGGDPGEEDSRPRRIAYWDFNEGTGTVLKDQSGNGHEGIIKGGAGSRGWRAKPSIWPEQDT